MNKEKEISILALGDSYTIGESVVEKDRYPVQLYARLIEEGFKVKYPEIIAKTGWTTRDLLNAIERTPPQKYNYDYVFILIGVNNQYQNIDIGVYKTEFTDLCHLAIKLSDSKPSHIIIISIPDYAFTPFGQEKNPQKTSSEIDQYNELNKQISEEFNFRYISITDVTRQGLQDKTLIAEDGLHPSGKCYAVFVDRIYKSVFENLINKGRD